jgi:hypothetical protein
MFGLKKKGPSQPFTHADNCRIVRADPTTEIEWSETSPGHWEAVCVCGHEYFNAPLTDDRDRLDPYDPSTFRHAGSCEHRDTTDPDLLRLVLKVKDGAGGAGGYWWVECGSCETGWQVPHYPIPSRRSDDEPRDTLPPEPPEPPRRWRKR